MRVTVSAWVACLSMTSAVQSAGTSFLAFVPITPGPYEMGSTLDIDILFHNQEGADIDIRLAQLDFAGTDPAFAIADFTMDLGGLSNDSLYFQDVTEFASGDTIASATYTGIGSVPGFIATVPHGGTLGLGTMSVTLPDMPDVFRLDAVNPGALTLDAGARIDYGFDDHVTLHALRGNLAGGQADFIFEGPPIPEPTTLVLLGVGAVCLGHRRRRAR